MSKQEFFTAKERWLSFEKFHYKSNMVKFTWL